jgi:hypothetical protein
MGHDQKELPPYPERRKKLLKAIKASRENWAKAQPKASAVPAAPAFVRWSVPQACVWIRTHDQAKADNLTPKWAACYSPPGSCRRSRARCRWVVLERGRFSMWARAAAGY